MSEDIQPKLIDPADNLFQSVVKERLEDLSGAAEEIIQHQESRRRKVPIQMFESVLLPIVRGWVRNDKDVEVGVWMNIADGMSAELDVVDAAGNILFTLPPPFLDTYLSNEAPQGRIVTPHTLVMQQEEMIRNGDQRGVMTIDQGLLETFSPKTTLNHKSRYIRMYVDIWQRYDLPLEEVLGPLTDKVKEALKLQGSSVSTIVQDKKSDDDNESVKLVY